MELYVRSRCDYGIMEFVFGGGAMYPETERLYMRKLAPSDHDALCAILKDEATMYAYAGAFCDAEVREWLDRQLAQYRKWGFWLWAVVLKESGEPIGQCGRTMQPWKDTEVLETGYLFNRRFAMRPRRPPPASNTHLKF